MTLFLLGSITAASVIFAGACFKCLIDARKELRAKHSQLEALRSSPIHGDSSKKWLDRRALGQVN